jgi:hypothetical protein
MSIEALICDLLFYQIAFKIYHWQTKRYSRHIAAEKLVGHLQDFTDSIVEYHQGRTQTRIVFPKDCIKIRNMTETDASEWLYVCTTVINNYTPESADLENKRTEILGHLHQLAYLFTLE